MDRRQLKTRNAIFRAFTELLNRGHYASITVQEIIDAANIGRSTFYAHFDTKDDLLKALSRELFDHIINTAMDQQDPNGLYACTNAPHSVFCHILLHLQENDNNILSLLTCESRGIFLGYFKSGMEELVRTATDQNFVPVVDDKGDFIGIVTRRAIMRYCLENYIFPKVEVS